MQPMPAPPLWLSNHGSEILLQVWVQPNAKKTAIAGEHHGCLKISVQAPPVDGAANETLLAFLAKRLGLRKNQLRIERGDTARRKSISCAGISYEAALIALGS